MKLFVQIKNRLLYWLPRIALFPTLGNAVGCTSGKVGVRETMGNSHPRDLRSGAILSNRSTAYTNSIGYETVSICSDSDSDLPFRFSFTRLANLPPLPGVHPLDYKAYLNTPTISTVSTKPSKTGRNPGRQTKFHLPMIPSHTHQMNTGGLVTVKEKTKEKKSNKNSRKKQKGSRRKRRTFQRL